MVFGPGGISLSLLPMVRILRLSKAVSTKHITATSTLFNISSILVVVVVGDFDLKAQIAKVHFFAKVIVSMCTTKKG